MKNQLAFGTLLFLTSHLVAPAALAQTAAPAGPQTTPPAGQTADPAQQGDQPAEQDVEISAPGASDGQEIVVVGRNIPNVIRSTPQVLSVLSSADIARTGEGDIAGALQRVTGLSVVGNGFVYVRGLGDRYSLSLLNGSPLPSPEPLRRVVPLDIFPTTVVASALVQKSFSANYPGEFGGGVINLTTQAIPRETFFTVGASVGFDTATSSELGYVYDGGRHDWLGYDSGNRRVPGFILTAGADRTNVTTANIIQLNNNNALVQSNFHLPPNWSGEVSFGTQFDLGGVRLGIIAGAGISNTWQTRLARQQVAVDALGALDRDFSQITTNLRALVNGLFGVGAEFGDHRVRWTNVYIHDTLKQARLGTGTDQNNGIINGRLPLIDQSTAWFERQLFTTQIVGEFDFGPLDVDVRGAYANTFRKSPYEREFTYIYSPLVNDFTNNLSQNPAGATIAFSDLDENLWSGGVDLAYDLSTDRPFTISAGYAYQDSRRYSYRYTFDFVRPGGVGLDLVYAQLRPDALLSDSSATANGIILRPSTTAVGARAYDAGLRIHAGYLQLEGEVFDGLRLTAGVRYEEANQFVTPSDAQPRTRLNNDYWLPATTATWNFAPNFQARLHLSKTIARPQFRELAPQQYLDYDTNRLFFGNPSLVDSELYNYEGRVEWFFGRDQRLTAAGFYKNILNPIETVTSVLSGGDALQTNFTNAPSAELWGGEVELQWYLPLDRFGGSFFETRRMVVIANYTYSQSEVFTNGTVINPFQPALGRIPATSVFQRGLPLQGQSDHLANVQIGIEDTDRLSQLTFLFNYASDRLIARGIQAGFFLPPIVERPGLRFDIVARQGIMVGGTEFELKFEARNLGNRPYREFQQFPNGLQRNTNSYNLGRVFSIGISAKL